MVLFGLIGALFIFVPSSAETGKFLAVEDTDFLEDTLKKDIKIVDFHDVYVFCSRAACHVLLLRSES